MYIRHSPPPLKRSAFSLRGMYTGYCKSFHRILQDNIEAVRERRSVPTNVLWSKRGSSSFVSSYLHGYHLWKGKINYITAHVPLDQLAQRGTKYRATRLIKFIVKFTYQKIKLLASKISILQAHNIKYKHLLIRTETVILLYRRQTLNPGTDYCSISEKLPLTLVSPN